MPQADRIRPEELSKAVAKAIEIATSKHKVELQPHLFQQDIVRVPGWIVGRVLRDQLDLNLAHKIAESITSSVNGKSGGFQPATVRIDRDILVGFIERYGNQIELPGSFQAPGL